MAQSNIEWTNSTWNPVTGCTKISPGCKHCYAERMAKRLQAMGQPNYANGFSVTLHPNMLEKPLQWKKPQLIFVNSMSDLFHDDVSEDFICSVWKVMRETPRHHYQILTKRPKRMLRIVSDRIKDVLPNVWLGTSVENDEATDRIDALRKVPAAIRFISFEPLIGAVGRVDLTDVHWAIVGGESGNGARPIKEVWIDEIHDQCSVYDTAFFFKQWGAWGRDNQKRSKKANGRQYRGRTWDEMPAFDRVNI